MLSAVYFYQKKDTVGILTGWYSKYYSTADITVHLPGGSLNLAVNRQDKVSAWKIYNQINTRIASVDFNEDYDSFVNVNKSLYELFKVIREELANIPVEKIKDENNTLVDFYHDLLNKGIRPYLSRWHIPISHYVEANKGDGKRSLLEIEKSFPQRQEMLKDMKAMNLRMKDYSAQLMKVIRS